MNKPLVSVVVISYNSSKTIEETLDSIKAQTYDNIELIVADDNSVDNTSDIAESYANGELRINAYDSPGSGVSYARNYGMRLARGRYLGFLDSDDSLDPDYLSVLVGNANEENADRVENNESIQAVFDNHKDIMNA